ncbi:hypothetical protein D3C76_1830260 [compost metagenome]
MAARQRGRVVGVLTVKHRQPIALCRVGQIAFKVSTLRQDDARPGCACHLDCRLDLAVGVVQRDV